MHVRTLAIAVCSLLLAGSVGWTQTPEIQKKVEKKLGELKKEKTKLDDLLALALKNHPDILVAESKLREADVALFRTRMQILEKVAMLYYEIQAARAAANEAKVRAERDQAAYDKGGLSAAELSVSLAAREKFQSDLARVEAQMEFLVGKHNAKAADWTRLYDTGFLTKPLSPSRLNDTGFIPAPVTGTMADKIRKALDEPCKRFAGQRKLLPADIIQILRMHVKGVNILLDLKNLVRDDDVEVLVQLDEAIPVGACFQWAEDTFNWRFIVRDYGIVAVDRGTVPPGAVLLLDFWRKGAAGPAQ